MGSGRLRQARVADHTGTVKELKSYQPPLDELPTEAEYRANGRRKATAMRSGPKAHRLRSDESLVFHRRRDENPVQLRRYQTFQLCIRAAALEELLASSVLSHLNQCMRVGDSDLLPPTSHDALTLPSAEQSAGGVEGSPGQVRYVLAGDRKDELDTFFGLAAGLGDHAQERVRDTLFNLLGRHLHDPGLGFLKAQPDRPVDARRKDRKARLRVGPDGVWLGQGDAVDRSDCRIRVGGRAYSDRKAKSLTLVNIPSDQQMAFW
jgi:hypothetical protein